MAFVDRKDHAGTSVSSFQSLSRWHPLEGLQVAYMALLNATDFDH
jgi:hypothetical protein